MSYHQILGSELFTNPIQFTQDFSQIDAKFDIEYQKDPEGLKSQLMSKIEKYFPKYQKEDIEDIDQERLLQTWSLIQMKSFPDVDQCHRDLIHSQQKRQQLKENQNIKLQQALQKITSGITTQHDLKPQNIHIVNQRLQEFKNQSNPIFKNLCEIIPYTDENDNKTGQNVNSPIKKLQNYKNKLMLLTMPVQVKKTQIYQNPQLKEIFNLLPKENKKLYHLRMYERKFELEKFLQNIMQGVISFDLNNCNLTNQDIQILVDKCYCIPHLVTLRLSFNKFSSITKQQLNNLKKKMKFLTKIQIQCRKDAQIKLSSQSVMEVLDFMYQQRLEKVHKTVVILNQLNLSQKQIDVSRWLNISPEAFNKVYNLNLQSSKIDDNKFIIITELLQHFSSLRQLNLYDNNIVNIPEKVLTMINRVTSDRSHVLRINLMKNNLDKETTVKDIQKTFTIKNSNNNKVVNKRGSTIVIQCDYELKTMQTVTQKEKKMQLYQLLNKIFISLSCGHSEKSIKLQQKIVSDLMRQIMGNRQLCIGFKDVEQIMNDVVDKVIASNNYNKNGVQINNNRLPQIEMVNDYKFMFCNRCILYNKLQKVFKKIKDKNKQIVMGLIMNQLKPMQLNESQATIQSTQSSQNNNNNANNNNSSNSNSIKNITIQEYIKNDKSMKLLQINKQIYFYQILQDIYNQLISLSQQVNIQSSQYYVQVEKKYEGIDLSNKDKISEIIFTLDTLVDKINQKLFYHIEIVRNHQQQTIRFRQRKINIPQTQHVNQNQIQSQLQSNSQQNNYINSQQNNYINSQSNQQQRQQNQSQMPSNVSYLSYLESQEKQQKM